MEPVKLKVSLLENEDNVAKLKYIFFYFTVAMFSFLLRDALYVPFITHPAFEHCVEYQDYAKIKTCVGKGLVYHSALALTGVFLTNLFLITLFRSYPGIRREVQNKYWKLKVFLYLLFFVSSLYVNPEEIDYWARLCLYGAGVFILMQIIGLIGWIEDLGHRWVESESFKKLTVTTIAIYLVSIWFIVYYYRTYAQGLECVRNQDILSLMSAGIVLYTLMAAVIENGSVFEAAMVTYYCIYWMGSGLSSFTDSCNPSSGEDEPFWKSLPSFLFAMISISYTSFNLTRKGGMFTFDNNQDDGENGELAIDGTGADSSYSYTFFQIVYFFASPYMAMVLTAWNPDETTQIEGFGTSDSTAWVKITMVALVMLIYVWTLVAPLLFPDRDFS